MHTNPVPLPPTDKPNISIKVPVNVFTGFLGSGKTTIISHLLETIGKIEKVVFIKNEIGDVEIDTKLLSGQTIASTEMLNGCVCCTLVGSLMESIEEILDTYNPDRIILESSGDAQPANLAITLNGNPRIYRDSMVTVIDCLNFDMEPKYNDHFQLQSKLTDLLILNKIEEVDSNKKAHIIETLRSFNTYSPITEAYDGKVDPNLVLGISSNLDFEKNNLAHEHSHQLESFSFSPVSSMSNQKLAQILDNLPENIIRVKGVVNLENELVIVNQAYKRRTLVKPKNQNREQTFLYFIGVSISQYQDNLIHLFKSI